MKITSVEPCILHLPSDQLIARWIASCLAPELPGAGTTPTPLAWDNYRRATT